MSDQEASKSVKQTATLSEILSQPAVWRGWSDALATEAARVQDFMASRNPQEHWLAGAGSSSFIGTTIANYLDVQSSTRVRAIASTDLVSSPQLYFNHTEQLLVTSFGRSGNSTESVGTLNLLDTLTPDADRLHITCNSDGALATRAPASATGEQRLLLLPESTHDSGFAMSVSYTTMLLSALACFDRKRPAPIVDLFASLATAAELLIGQDLQLLGLSTPPARAVFVGSGALVGSARESALKVLELTAGRVVGCADTVLGFRHGPKAIVDSETLIFVLVSQHEPTQQYDVDLAAELADQYGPQKVVTLGPPSVDPTVAIPAVGNDAWSAVLPVVFAQCLAVKWSQHLGLNVDNPFQDSGHLNRVVEHVRLHSSATGIRT